jgi:hypothetical protein
MKFPFEGMAGSDLTPEWPGPINPLRNYSRNLTENRFTLFRIAP